MSLLDISGLKAAADSGAFMPSPFAPSYMQRASGDLGAQSPSGIFTFTGYSRTAPYLNSTSLSNSITLSESQTSVASYSIAAWIYPESQNGLVVGASGAPSHSLELGIGTPQQCESSSSFFFHDDQKICGSLPGSFFFGDVNSGTAIGVNTLGQFQLNRWYFVVGTFNSVSGSSTTSSQFKLYVNGVNASASSLSYGSDTSPLSTANGVQIGGYGYNGMVAGVQIYDSALAPSQVYKLYQDGISSLPASGSQLAGWYPLDGNANDLSGNGNYPVSSPMPSFVQVPSYMRDSAFPASTSRAYPVPGLLDCNSNLQCINYTLPHLYLASDSPLELNNGGISAAYFNGQESYFSQGGGFRSLSVSKTTVPFSISVWVYPMSGNGVIVSQYIFNALNTNNGKGDLLNRPIMQLSNGNLYLDMWKNSCSNVGSVPVGQWSNLVLTVDENANKYYGYINTVQGAWDAGKNEGLDRGTSMMYILGAVNNANNCDQGTSLPFQGLIANYQFYNMSLNQQQINQIYLAGIDGSPVVTSNALGWWPLSGNGNDYINHNTGYGNSLSYEFIQYNYSEVNSPEPGQIGLSNVSGVSGEWQSLGFPAPSLQQARWNVTSWTLSTNTKSLSYGDVATNPSNPSGVTPNQTGSFFSGLYFGDQAWSFGSAQYRGINFLGSPAVPFPYSLSILNSNVSCSEPFNSTGYTATANFTLSGAYNFSIAYDDAMDVFYRPVGSSNWISVFPSGTAWPTVPNDKPQNLGPSEVIFSPGEYQIAVDWNNDCGGGLSSFQMSQ